MKIKEIKDKKTKKSLKTKEGKVLKDKMLEAGDEFIPEFNRFKEVVTEYEEEGQKKKVTNHFLKCKVKGKEGKIIENEDEETDDDKYKHFIRFTDGQVKVMKKLIDEGVQLNQNIFSAYEYTNDYGTQVGVGIKKDLKDPIDF